MKNGYDPHLLYQAINITVELQYTVPMTLIYNLLLKLKIQRKPGEKEPKIDEVVRLLSLMGNTLQDEVSAVEIEDMEKDLQTKIKYVLKLTKCQLTPQELNQILKGQLSIKDVLTKEAQLAWNIMFEQKDGRYVPSAQNTSWLLDITQEHTLGQMLKEYNQNCLKYAQAQAKHLDNKAANVKTDRANKEAIVYMTRNKTLEEKLRKVRLLVAHLQGYDRDRDGDGERGVDPETGYIRDFDDVFAAVVGDNVVAAFVDVDFFIAATSQGIVARAAVD